MRYDNNKKIMIIKTIIIFLSLFLFSFGYRWMPNFISSLIFPVNESLFEHLKMIFNAEIIVSLMIYLVVKKKNIKVNNYFTALLLSTLFNIILFYLIYLPIYNRFGSNLIMTMTIYFITLCISQYLFYLICNKDHNKFYNKISLIVIPLIWLILIYFTYNPLRTEFFFDPIDEIYGIPVNRK
ncbi:MAG: hypothetical protein IKN63_00080 [Bacilli bacterium]|nr:hypothetical protein [Bacilli bacterium]